MYQYTYCSYLRRIDIKGIELTWYVSVTLVFPHKSMSHSNMIPAALCSSAYACHLHATSKLFIPLIMYKYSSSIGSGILLHWYIVLLVIIFLLYLSQTLCLPKNWEVMLSKSSIIHIYLWAISSAFQLVLWYYDYVEYTDVYVELLNISYFVGILQSSVLKYLTSSI